MSDIRRLRVPPAPVRRSWWIGPRSMTSSLRQAIRALAVAIALVLTAVGLQACKPACGVTASTSAAIGSTAAGQAPVAAPKPKPKPKPCPPGKSGKSKMRGANGTQVTSQTLANGTVGQYKYRIDVENPAPGKRPGSLHVQLGGKGSKHYEYSRGKFVARDGTRLPRAVQKAIDKDPDAQQGIRKGLKILGEK